jgi:large subunit ribosomal protein L35
MPKMKTRSTVKKRFRLTAGGKVKRKKMNLRHLLTGKSAKRRRRLGRKAMVNPVQAKKLKMMMSGR